VSASVSECEFSVGASLQWESVLSFEGREQVRGAASTGRENRDSAGVMRQVRG
jgi:hypothetical protein